MADISRTKDGLQVRIKLDAFEGPLDLLLHLIRVNEIDIFDIPIVEITDQYFEYINAMKEVDIDLSSEFMLMAATLIHIKTKMMLPRKPEEEDPRAELVERLLEHQHYKLAGESLGDREEEELTVWHSPSKRMKPYVEVEEELVVADIFQLISAFQRVMKEIGRHEDLSIEHQHFTIDDKIRMFTERIGHQPRLLFSEVTRTIKTKRELVVTFLALLELMRRKVLVAVQAQTFGDIVILLKDRDQALLDI